MEPITLTLILMGILCVLLALSPPLVGAETPSSTVRGIILFGVLFMVYGLFQGLFIITTASMTPGGFNSNIALMHSNMTALKVSLGVGVLVVFLDAMRYGGPVKYLAAMFDTPQDWNSYPTNEEMVGVYRLSPRLSIMQAKFIILMVMVSISSLLLLVIPGLWPLSIFLIFSGMMAVDVSTISPLLLGKADQDIYDETYLRRITGSRYMTLLKMSVPRIPTAIFALRQG